MGREEAHGEVARLPETVRQIQRRKRAHLAIVLDREVGYRSITTGFGDVALRRPRPLPPREKVDTSTVFLGRTLSMPVEMAAMIGGIPEARALNRRLAAAAEAHRLVFCLGSQKAMIRDRRLAGTYRVRDVAPTAVVMGNIGYADLHAITPSMMRRALDDVGADGLYIHVNPEQELRQPEGGRRALEGEIGRMNDWIRAIDRPVGVKTVGQGADEALVRLLCGLDAAVVHLSGAGGTNWSYIESLRAGARGRGERGAVSTVRSMLNLAATSGQGAPGRVVVLSGGVRTGGEVGRAIALGADLAGLARPFLVAADRGEEGELCALLRRQLVAFMRRAGARSIDALGKVGLTIGGETARALDAAGRRSLSGRVSVTPPR